MELSKNRKFGLRIVVVVIASFIAAINIKTFVSAGGLFPGGFTGLTVFIQRVGSTYFDVVIPYTPVNLLLNALPIYIGIKMIGKKFTMLSCLMIVLTGIFVDFLPHVAITEDILLIAVFGGLINGVAMSIALRAKASGGGTDFMAMALSKKLNEPAWNYMLGMNFILLLVAGYLFGWDKALYSIIFQYCSTTIVNMLHINYKKMTIFIVTSKPDEVMQLVMNKTHHGITRFEGVGGYSNLPRTMLYTVLSAEEVKRVKKEIRKTDDSAFINATKTEHLDGRFYQKPID